MIPLAISSDGTWILIYPDGSNVVSGGVDDRATIAESPAGLASDVADVVLTDQAVTVLATPSSCRTGKASCTYSVIVLQSRDLGRTWSPIK